MNQSDYLKEIPRFLMCATGHLKIVLRLKGDRGFDVKDMLNAKQPAQSFGFKNNIPACMWYKYYQANVQAHKQNRLISITLTRWQK